jgi:hypothetical protein
MLILYFKIKSIFLKNSLAGLFEIKQRIKTELNAKNKYFCLN